MFELREKSYLGDGVYAGFDGYHIVFYLDDGSGPYNEISLEPEVLQRLDNYRESLKIKLDK